MQRSTRQSKSYHPTKYPMHPRAERPPVIAQSRGKDMQRTRGEHVAARPTSTAGQPSSRHISHVHQPFQPSTDLERQDQPSDGQSRQNGRPADHPHGRPAIHVAARPPTSTPNRPTSTINTPSQVWTINRTLELICKGVEKMKCFILP